jgi:hypothetical protein
MSEPIGKGGHVSADIPANQLGPLPAVLTKPAMHSAIQAAAREVEATVKASVPLGDNSAEACAVRAEVIERQMTDYDRRCAAERERARADWTALRARLADNPPAAAALDLHQPEGTYGVHCATCYDSCDGCYGEDWPCDTYEAIREAADG